MGAVYYLMGHLNPILEPGEIYEYFVNIAYLLNLEERPLAVDLGAIPVPVLIEDLPGGAAVLEETYERRYKPWTSEGGFLEGVRLRLPLSGRKTVNLDLLFDVQTLEAVQLEGMDPVSGKIKATEVRINRSFFPIYEFGLDPEGVSDNLVYYLLHQTLRRELRNRRTLYLVDDITLNEARRNVQKKKMEPAAALESLLFQARPHGVILTVEQEKPEDFLSRAREVYQKRRRAGTRKNRGVKF